MIVAKNRGGHLGAIEARFTGNDAVGGISMAVTTTFGRITESAQAGGRDTVTMADLLAAIAAGATLGDIYIEMAAFMGGTTDWGVQGWAPPFGGRLPPSPASAPANSSPLSASERLPPPGASFPSSDGGVPAVTPGEIASLVVAGGALLTAAVAALAFGSTSGRAEQVRRSVRPAFTSPSLSAGGARRVPCES